jgi:signal transduction histidine kinase/CheY-like chemotaxis protein
MNRFRVVNRSIKTRLLLWFLAVALLPLFLTTLISQLISESALRQEIITSMEALAAGKARQIENYALERKRDVSAVARIPQVSSLISQFTQPDLSFEERSAAEASARAFIGYYGEEGRYSDLYLVDAAGTILFSLNSSVPAGTALLGADFTLAAMRQAFENASTLLETELSDFTELNGEYVAFIAAPVFAEGIITGVIIAQIGDDVFTSVVTDAFGLGESGETIVGSVQGESILVTAPLRNTPDAAFRLRLSTQNDIPLARAVRGVRGQGIVTDYRQQEVVAAWRYLPSLRWGLVVKKDTSEAFASITRTRTSLFVLSLSTLVGVGVAALFISRSLSEPLVRLREVVRRLAGGSLGVRAADTHRHDEIGDLVRGINEMGDQLSVLVNDLEARVQERTLELEAARQAAESANLSKSKFLSSMSHELRTPLNAILGFSQIMGRDQKLDAKHREHLKIITRSGDHLLALINDVLEMSKIEAGQSALNPTPYDLRTMLKSIQDMFQLRAESKHIQLLFEVDASVPRYVNGDEAKLRQVLVNLISNAVKFTHQGGVALRSRYDHATQRLMFEVEDTGEGISQEDMEKLFKPFVQTASGVKSQQGTGLGLSISQQFVTMMGGHLTLRSEVGRGTIFHFDVPLELASERDLPQAPSRRRVVGIRNPQREIRVLIVDDRPENRQLMREWMSLIQFSVREASNGQEALTIWEEWEPQLIWMDMQMPVMDGYEATRRIKSTIKGQATTVIAFTASAFEHERSIVLSAGCDDFVRKPAVENLIYEKVEQFLGVELLYEEEAPAEAEPADDDVVLRQLRQLPASVLHALGEAVDDIDVERTQTLLADLGAQHDNLATVLRGYVASYRFDHLQHLLNMTKGEAQ